jgi:hypothetical protein
MRNETARRVEENDSTKQHVDEHSPIPLVIELKSYKEAINRKRYGADRPWNMGNCGYPKREEHRR